MRRALYAALAMGTIAGLSTASCSKQEPTSNSYFERSISPILTTSCVRTNTGAGCHVADPKGNAFGNLDVSTFAGVDHRRDLLVDYGPYSQPAMLVKNVAPFQIDVETFDGVKATITTDIKHAGGDILDPTASSYQTLRRWIDNGATDNNTGPRPATALRLPCVDTPPPPAPGFDPNADPPRGDYGSFLAQVVPVVHATCAAGNCHGAPSNELYFLCGNTPDQQRWNYYIASRYLAQTPEQAELARRPLGASQGGSFHEGGVIFDGTSDPGYQAILAWAKDHGPAKAEDYGGPLNPNFAFFAHRVQPMLVKKGCMMMQCHSPALFHDYRLRGGSGGEFGYASTRRNYELSLAQLALESDDVDASRIVRKNLFRPELVPGSLGLAHRGGPLFEDFGQGLATGKACDDKAWDYDNGNLDQIPAYCIVREWHRRERAARGLGHVTAVVWVKRTIPGGSDRPLDFDQYAGGAELHVAPATLDATTGDLTTTGDATVNGACGLDASSADVRRPTVSWDGAHVAFAARSSASEPLAVYQMDADGSNCAKIAEIDSTPPTGNGLLIHNFDPVYGPDGTIVFASTRGNLAADAYDYQGPQRTPSNVARPNANLYALGPDKKLRQLTYHLNTERQPSFMADGRIIFTAEKRAKDFYQLALRRLNADGGDYHPLFAQRGSIGYHEAFDVVELADKNFAAIFSDPGVPHAGGALGVFNRSLGVDFTSSDPKDYLVDPSVIDPAAPASPEPSFFLHSLRFVDPTVSGKPGAPTSGLYTAPSALPDGKMLVSFGAAGDPATFGGDYDVYVMDPISGQKTRLLGDPGSAEIDAVAVYPRAVKPQFTTPYEEPNAFTTLLPGRPEADVLVLDMPVLGSLLFQNTPTGRVVETFSSFEVWEDLPPPVDMTSASGPNVANDAFGAVFVKRRLLGSVPVQPDGSAHFAVPGGLPVLFKLPDTPESKARGGLPRVQRETLVFAPGEYLHQSFQQQFFNGLCAQCHGSVSGKPVDVAVQPDFLTGASQVISRGQLPAPLAIPPAQRGATEGP